MLRYELDDYVQEHVADDAVNANCVVSWRARTDGEGRQLFLRFVSVERAKGRAGSNLASTAKE